MTVPTAKNRDIRILVLDDEPFMLKLITNMLGNLGYTRIETFANGHAALERLDDGSKIVDLIMLDLNMPGMDGVEFIRNLADRTYRGSLVLVSGVEKRILETAHRLAQGRRMKILGHLQKPVKPQDLEAMLQRWEPDRDESIRTERRIYTADELGEALAGGQLVNYYQPQLDVATGMPIAVEALVRWQHPQDGTVFPDQFIGVAEDTGLIDELTRVVLTAAARQARAWHDRGLRLRVAVNLSMDNLNSLDFPDFVANTVTEFGVSPADIILEVTESRLMRDLRETLDILTRLRLKGFRLSIDDFGTGNSSLVQLRDIPFSELKIDRGFINGVDRDSTLRAIYDASLGLARQLRMETVAEGVEDRNDWELLSATKCDLAQGYFISRPMTADKVADWVAAWDAVEWCTG